MYMYIHVLIIILGVQCNCVVFFLQVVNVLAKSVWVNV